MELTCVGQPTMVCWSMEYSVLRVESRLRKVVSRLDRIGLNNNSTGKKLNSLFSNRRKRWFTNSFILYRYLPTQGTGTRTFYI